MRIFNNEVDGFNLVLVPAATPVITGAPSKYEIEKLGAQLFNSYFEGVMFTRYSVGRVEFRLKSFAQGRTSFSLFCQRQVAMASLFFKRGVPSFIMRWKIPRSAIPSHKLLLSRFSTTKVLLSGMYNDS
jgi:hypothetical protein